MANLDSIDEQLIKLLQLDALQSSEVLAKKLNISPSAVRRRKRILLKNDMIRIIAATHLKKIGLPVMAVMALDIDHDKLASVVKLLVNRPEVTWASSTTGRYDIIATIAFASTEELSLFVENEIPKIPGIRDTETFICLHVVKTRL